MLPTRPRILARAAAERDVLGPRLSSAPDGLTPTGCPHQRRKGRSANGGSRFLGISRRFRSHPVYVSHSRDLALGSESATARQFDEIPRHSPTVTMRQRPSRSVDAHHARAREVIRQERCDAYEQYHLRGVNYFCRCGTFNCRRASPATPPFAQSSARAAGRFGIRLAARPDRGPRSGYPSCVGRGFLCPSTGH